MIENRLENLAGRVKKVRWYLVALTALKVAALCLAFVSLYVAIYAWLDHRLHLGSVGRVTALSLLIACAVGLLVVLIKALVRHVSCSQAANFVERKINFEQQLVTAIEYYEHQADYPYSRSLADHLVRQVDRASSGIRLDQTVPKWQLWAFSAVIFLGLCVGGAYLHSNYVFFAPYLARLFQPLAPIEPLPATKLTALTGDIVVEPEEMIKPAAAIEGRVPESGALTVEHTGEKKGSDEQVPAPPSDLHVPLDVSYDDKKAPKLQAELTLPTGAYRYRFEAGDAASDWHTITVSTIPKLKAMTARVTVPSAAAIEPYTEKIENQTLEVIKGSTVTVSVQATETLSKAVVTDPAGKQLVKEPAGADTFDFEFVADREGFARLELTGETGVTNPKIPALQVMLKKNEPATLKLISPKGDYMATNVASIPITFEAEDDFGLDSLAFYIEINGQEPKPFSVPIDKGVKKAAFTQTLELEEYDLAMGDSILFYAQAIDLDVHTGMKLGKTSTSEVYFIEIRPYRELWFQLKSQLPHEGKQGLEDKQGAHDSLLAILKYTRAIVKKTWVIAHQEELTPEDRSKLDAINKDVKYAAEELTKVRDDPRYRFDDLDKAELNKVLEYYGQASGQLSKYQVEPALQAERQAYQALRKFIKTLYNVLPPPGVGSGQSSGQGSPGPQPGKPDKPDKVTLEDEIHLTRYEKERIEWELKKLAHKLEQMRAEQEALKKRFEHFLADQRSEDRMVQKTTDERSWTDPTEKPREVKPPEAGPSEGDRQQEPPSKIGVDGALPPPPKVAKQDDAASQQQQAQAQSQQRAQPQAQQQSQQQAGQQQPRQGQQQAQQQDQQAQPPGQQQQQQQQVGQQQGQQGRQPPPQEGQQAQPPGQQQAGPQMPQAGQGPRDPRASGYNIPGKTHQATSQERMKILEARQKALQQEVDELKQAMNALPLPGQEEKEALNQARAARAETSRYLDLAARHMGEFQKHLADAYYKAGQVRDQRLDQASKAQQAALLALSKAKDALEGQFTQTEFEKLAKASQEAAEKLIDLANRYDASVTEEEKRTMLADLELAKRLLETMQGQLKEMVRVPGAPDHKRPRGSSGSVALPQVEPLYQGDLPPEEKMRLLALQFWSIAIEAQREQGILGDDDASDAQFHELEKRFFENAARFHEAQVKE